MALKNFFMQSLLTIGERSITAALQGGNTAAAKRMLLTLMQNDTVVPLLVAGASVRTNAHVQEGLLRLQLQKLRFQLAAHETGTPRTRRQPVRTLNELLPNDLLDPDKPGTAQAARLAVTSTGLQPLGPQEALGELWHSLQPCLQPGAPLLAALDSSRSSAGGLALSSSVQLLAEWTAACGAHTAPTWLPALREILRRDDMHARLSQQLLLGQEGDGVVDWGALLAQVELMDAPAATALAAAAVTTGAPLHTAWLAFGDWLYARARRARHARRAAGVSASKAPLTPSDSVAYCHVVLAYARALSLDALSGSGLDTTRLLLRLLHFAIHHEDSSMQAAIRVALRLVPPAAWQVLALQRLDLHVARWMRSTVTWNVGYVYVQVCRSVDYSFGLCLCVGVHLHVYGGLTPSCLCRCLRHSSSSSCSTQSHMCALTPRASSPLSRGRYPPPCCTPL